MSDAEATSLPRPDDTGPDAAVPATCAPGVHVVHGAGEPVTLVFGLRTPAGMTQVRTPGWLPLSASPAPATERLVVVDGLPWLVPFTYGDVVQARSLGDGSWFVTGLRARGGFLGVTVTFAAAADREQVLRVMGAWAADGILVECCSTTGCVAAVRPDVFSELRERLDALRLLVLVTAWQVVVHPDDADGDAGGFCDLVFTPPRP